MNKHHESHGVGETTYPLQVRRSADSTGVRRRILPAALLATMALTALAVAQPAAAQFEWNGTQSQSWFNGGNWDPVGTPGPTDDVLIDINNPNLTTVSGAAAAPILDLTVGRAATGTLFITGGGSVDNEAGLLGELPGSLGAVTVDGAGSTWGNAQNLRVGLGGSGTLNITNGGQVLSTGASGVGLQAGSDATALVTGAGSDWSNAGTLVIGDSGTGTLLITNTAIVSNGAGTVGREAGGVGTVSVNNATWTNTQNLLIGSSGTGGLTIANGGTVSNETGRLGVFQGGEGTVTVTGVGSAWNNADRLFVGEAGTGTLTIEQAATVTGGGGAFLGDQAGSEGTVTVTDANSAWSIGNQTLLVGFSGTGTLTIANGGSTDAGFLAIADQAGSQGTVTVTGTNSSLANGANIVIGNVGTGTLTIADGGQVSSGSFGFIGFGSNGQGNVTVTGMNSAWDLVGDLIVSRSGPGTLTISDGGEVTSAFGFLGREAGGEGTVTVAGTNSNWTMTDDLTVGEGGTGTLTVEDGGEVANWAGFIGLEAGSEGTVEVVDTGSLWDLSSILRVGDGGTGTLRITGGSGVSVVGQSEIGRQGDAVGTVIVSDPGTSWTSGGFLSVGGSGTGTLLITNGATVSNTNGRIGDLAGSEGTVRLGSGGPGATWTNTGNLIVGNFGTGTLEIGDGALVTAAGTVSVADQPGSAGALLVNGDLASGGGITVNSGGWLGGSGTVTGSTAMNGTVAPGSSIGTLTIAGNYTQNVGSTYEVEIDGLGNSDLIDVAGLATLSGGTVEVVRLPDFALATPYTILTAVGGVVGTFDDAAMDFGSLFLSPEVTYDPNNAFLTIVQSASFESVALTPNQTAAAAGADNLGPGHAVWNAVVLLDTEEEAQAAFDALSGEVHASIKSGLLEDSRFVREAVTDRVRQAFASPVVAAPMLALAYSSDGAVANAADLDSRGLAMWARGYGSWGTWDSDGNAATLDRSIAGFFLGADALIAETWRLGLAAGYSRASLDVDARASSADVYSTTLAAYGGRQWGDLGLRFGAAHTWHHIEANRSIVFPGFFDQASASYDARTAQVFGEVGYALSVEEVAVEPFAGLAYVHVDADGLTEAGGAAALAGFSSSEDVIFSTLGVRAATAFALTDTITATARGTLGWRHAFGDRTPDTTLSFAGGDAFTVAGVPIARDAAVLEAGLDLDLTENATFGLAYAGQVGDGAQDHSLKLTLSARF